MRALQESFRKKSPCGGILASAAMMLLACLQIADARAEVGASRVMNSGLQIGGGEIMTSITQQKTKTVTVVVTDEMGEIAGANIVVKGTSIMNISDMSGKAVLTNVPVNAELQISYIGYSTQTIALGGRDYIEVRLEEDAKALDEVVVIGYGTAKKGDLTSAVGVVTGNTIAQRKTMRVSQALQGAMPGLSVTRGGSEANSSATLRVRGTTSINSSDPLVLVDGVPGTLDWVHSEDIESITVLKDAASASIYGSKAAAGVILVTTKRGKEGKVNISYNFEHSIDKPTQVMKYVSAVPYMKIYNEQAWNTNGNTGSEFLAYTEQYINEYEANHAANPDLYPDVSYIDAMLKKSSFSQSHKLNITAGNKNVKSVISAQYDRNQRLYKADYDYDRVMVRANNDITFNKYLKASFDVNATYSVADGPAWTFGPSTKLGAPIYAYEWTNGQLAPGKSGENYYGLMMEGGFDKTTAFAVGGKIQLDIMPIDGLKISGVFSPQLYSAQSKRFEKKTPYYNEDDPEIVAGYVASRHKTSLTEGRPNYHNTTAQVLANYMKQFGDHDLNVLAGFENYYYFGESLSASRDYYTLDSYPYLNTGNENYQYNGGSAYENATRSWFGRVMYNYKNRYYLQVNGRYDGSSRFAKEHRWGFFPSVSAGWALTEESFMPKSDILSYLKLRGSYGTLGNERIGDYPYQSIIGFSNSLMYQGSTPIMAQSAGVYSFSIYDISWEKTRSYDIGLDAYFFNNRLSLAADVYRKDTEDMLLQLEIPKYVGLSNPYQNAGKMHTNGMELNLGWQDKVGDFNYSIAANLSYAKTKMGDLKGTQFLGDQVIMEGSEFKEWYGYLSDGLYQSKEAVAGTAVMNENVTAGDVKYVDVSGPDGVPDGKITPDYDRVFLGSSIPKINYGAQFNAGYKNFDFGLTLQGTGSYKARLNTNQWQPFGWDQWTDVPQNYADSYWSYYNTPEQNLKARYPRVSTVGNDNNSRMSDFWLFNGAYLRVKNITLGYTIPKEISQKFLVNNLRVYVSANDLFCFDHYPEGIDPEASNYWITKSFIFGASVQF